MKKSFMVISYTENGTRCGKAYYDTLADALQAAGPSINGAHRSDPTIWEYSQTAGDYKRLTAAEIYERANDDDTPAEETQVQIANKLHVSARNSKLGHVPNMSLTPGRTCSACACKTCLVDGCYAMKSYRQYPATRAAWDDNTALALQDLPAMERGLTAYFTAGTAPTKKKPITFFRLHVGGDFVSTAYAWMWFRIAQAFPGVHFLAFTKQFDVVRPVPFYTLPNFALRLSDWPGTEIPEDLRKLYHVAWMNDGTRPADTFPAGCLQCPGNCETCGACWGYDGDTIFDKH